MSLRELYKALEAHDWYYAMSDDGSVYNKGHIAERQLRAAANLISGGQALFDAFALYQFSGPAWNRPQAPKPEMPAEVTP